MKEQRQFWNARYTAIAPQARIDALKEHLLPGHTVMALARKTGGGVPH